MAVAFAVNIYLTLFPILLHIFRFLCYMSHSDIFCLISISRFQIKKIPSSLVFFGVYSMQLKLCLSHVEQLLHTQIYTQNYFDFVPAGTKEEASLNLFYSMVISWIQQ